MANKKEREQRPGEARQPGRSQPRGRSRPQPGQRSRQQRRRAAPSVSRTTLLAIVGGVAVLVVAILIVVSLGGGPAGTPATTGDSSIKGSADAKVTVEEFSDFQCPYCAQFALGTFPSIDKDYIETGKVRWVYRNMARIGEESKQAAQAAECAGDQGQFWPYHDKLFTSQQGENRGAFSSDKLKSFAKTLGLDSDAFNSCLDSGKYSNLVNNDLVEGNRKGVTGTPTFFVNGRKLEGTRPYGDFQKAIEAALKQ